MTEWDLNNRKECPLRGNLGNCSPVGGFCYDAVSDEICEAVHNAYEKGKSDGIKLAKAKLKRTGEWLEVGFGKPDAWDCSICGAMAGRKSLFCSGCGAKMKNGSRAVKCYERNNLVNVEKSKEGS